MATSYNETNKKCKQCGESISPLIEALYKRPYLCSNCTGEQQEKIKGGYRLWTLLPDGSRSQERVWCPGCRYVLCKKGLEHYNQQCASCQRMIDDLADVSEWPDGCIEFLDGTIWYPEHTGCHQGSINNIHNRSAQCEKCKERHEQWLNEHVRKDIRYSIQTMHKLDVVYFTSEKKPGMRKNWVKPNAKMEFLAKKEGTFAIRLVPEPQNTKATVTATCLNISSGKRERIPVKGQWSRTFASREDAQQWIAECMGQDLRNFWC